jgi:TolA-binding protein
MNLFRWSSLARLALVLAGIGELSARAMGSRRRSAEGAEEVLTASPVVPAAAAEGGAPTGAAPLAGAVTSSLQTKIVEVPPSLLSAGEVARPEPPAPAPAKVAAPRTEPSRESKSATAASARPADAKGASPTPVVSSSGAKSSSPVVDAEKSSSRAPVESAKKIPESSSVLPEASAPVTESKSVAEAPPLPPVEEPSAKTAAPKATESESAESAQAALVPAPSAAPTTGVAAKPLSIPTPTVPPAPPEYHEGPREIREADAPDALRDYARVADLLKEGHEDSALLSAGDFLRRYPTHPLAASAQYQIGEVYLRKRDFNRARAEFAKARAFHVADPRQRAQIAVRIGLCFRELRDLDKARVEWNAVVRRHPGTPEAEEAQLLLKGLP